MLVNRAKYNLNWLRDSLTKTMERKVIMLAILFVSLWRGTLELCNYFAFHWYNIKPYYPEYLSGVHKNIVNAAHGAGHWVNWDGYHYLGIVVQGYGTLGLSGAHSEVAFFPGFPASVRLFQAILPLNAVLIGLVINFILTILIAIGIFKLATLMTYHYAPSMNAAKVGYLSVLLYFCYPSTLFLAAFYADALLVFAVTWALYFALKERYFLTAVLVAVAAATKSTSLVLLPGIIALICTQMDIKKDWRKAGVRLLLVAGGFITGLGGYMVYLTYRFNDPLLFYKVQSLWSRHSGGLFIKRLWEVYYQHLLNPSYYGHLYQYLIMLLVLALPLLVLSIGTWCYLRWRIAWVPVLGVCLLLGSLESGIMESLNRYVLILTPYTIVIAWAIIKYKVPRLGVAILLLSGLALQYYFALGFLQGPYFAG